MSQRLRTDLIVFHCSATRPTQNIGRAEIEEWHLAKGWQSIGYHFVIRRDGTLEPGRSVSDVGAHVAGFNANSVGVCMVGGLDEDGKSFANEPNQFTAAQWKTAKIVRDFLKALYPRARVCGHRDLSPDTNRDGKIQPQEWLKTCPGFDATSLFAV